MMNTQKHNMDTDVFVELREAWGEVEDRRQVS